MIRLLLADLHRLGSWRVIAKALGVSESCVWRWANGDHHPTDLHMAAVWRLHTAVVGVQQEQERAA